MMYGVRTGGGGGGVEYIELTRTAVLFQLGPGRVGYNGDGQRNFSYPNAF